MYYRFVIRPLGLFYRRWGYLRPVKVARNVYVKTAHFLACRHLVINMTTPPQASPQRRPAPCWYAIPAGPLRNLRPRARPTTPAPQTAAT